MPTPDRLHDPDSRGYLHQSLQRRVVTVAIGLAVVLAIVLIPLMTNPELRLDVFRSLNFVPSEEGELVAGADSGATLVVLPLEQRLESSDRVEVRFLATYITRPTEEGMQLEPVNGGEPFAIPLQEYDLVSSSPDGRQVYIRGERAAVLIDTQAHRVIEELSPDADPEVTWDWRQATWAVDVGRCDLVSPSQTWIGCFERPVLANYLAGDWHLSIHRYGDPDEQHDIARGLGFRPMLGFSADDAWIYLYNEQGIRRYSVDDAAGG